MKPSQDNSIVSLEEIASQLTGNGRATAQARLENELMQAYLEGRKTRFQGNVMDVIDAVLSLGDDYMEKPSIDLGHDDFFPCR
ncbi:hypothetical protein DSO57_1038295 [Entomophthora muscae]|uniref:Uncharacterized protein n=1 Tax=Entomophthora muscae TaxID=34485 RepID=A0ACC2SYT9_9FUNG|nr:hypothetical protein DSO57_1038295 [Entomophthora muscae]